MKYYNVAVVDSRLSNSKMLTYSSENKLQPGDVVVVPVSAKTATAVVIESSGKPSFPTKPIAEPALLSLPADLLDLARWISAYYVAELGSTLSTMLPRGLNKNRRTSFEPESQSQQTNMIELSDTQNKVVADITTSDTRSHLLHGATGSGKTHIYLSLIKAAIDKSQSAILLVPEIGLSRHLLERIKPILSVPVIELSSDLTAAQRHVRWNYILNSEQPVVVVGPRSAVFAPVQKLGVIIIDEAHDDSYSETSRPHYDATYVAATRAANSNAKLVMGTATPNVAQYWLAQRQMQIHELPSPHYDDKKQQISVVSLRDKSLFKSNRQLSRPLLDSIEASLSKNQQSLLFINKRGFAHNAHCIDCGWIMECETCQLPVVYHKHNHSAQCHTCGSSYSPPSSCASCGSTEIRFDSPGTQRIEQDIKKLFSGANVIRADRDQAQSESAINQADILIGTQLLIKGFDLPRLTTVGVLHADSGLGLPDYTASENVFQQLRQVIGRNNRRGKGGHTIVQALQTEHHAIQTAVTDNYQLFYDTELAHRRQAHYPPFTHLLLIKMRYKTKGKAANDLGEIKHKLLADFSGVEILGPSPALRQFAHGYDQWQLLVKSSQRSTLAEIAKQIQSGSVNAEINPISLL